MVFGAEHPYVDGGGYGTQGITRTRDTLCYTGLNTNDVAGKPGLNLTDIFSCDPVLLEEQTSPFVEEIVEKSESWWIDPSHTLHFNFEDQVHHFTLTNLEGKVLWQKTLEGEGSVTLPAKGLSAGVYMLRGGHWPAKKFMVR